MTKEIAYSKEKRDSIFTNNIFKIYIPRLEQEYQELEQQPTFFVKPFSAVKSETIRQFAEKTDKLDFNEAEDIRLKIVQEMILNIVDSKNIMLSDLDNTIDFKSDDDAYLKHSEELVFDFINRDELTMNIFVNSVLQNIYKRLNNISNQKKT